MTARGDCVRDQQIQLSNSPRLRSSGYVGLSVRTPDARHRPVFCPAPGHAGLEPQMPSSFPRRGVRNDRAFHRARGATWVTTWHPCAESTRQTTASDAGRRLRSAREWILRLAACPRRRRFRRRFPVRANCRPDMHLGRPPVLPASVPSSAFRISDPDSSSRVRHRGGHRIPLSTSRRRPRRAP